MKSSDSKILLIGLVLVVVTGCKSLPVANKYHYVEAGIDDLSGLEKIEGILITNHYHPEMAGIVFLIGNQDKVEKIIGREINPERTVSDPAWIERIYQNYLKAKRVNNLGRGSANDSRMVFVTKKRAYMIEFGVDEEDGKYTVVYGDDYESEHLRNDFEELGILEHKKPAKEPTNISEKLAFRVMKLDHQAMEFSIQVHWFSDRLERCLAEIEAQKGLEPIPFDWDEAIGFKMKSDPNITKLQSCPSQSRPFYMPFPRVKKQKIKKEWYERFSDPKNLSAYVEMQLSARKAYMLGMDRYIEHLEKRLKRLDPNQP